MFRHQNPDGSRVWIPDCIKIGKNTTVKGRIYFYGPAKIGDDCELIAGKKSVIHILDDVSLENGTQIHAKNGAEARIYERTMMERVKALIEGKGSLFCVKNSKIQDCEFETLDGAHMSIDSKPLSSLKDKNAMKVSGRKILRIDNIGTALLEQESSMKTFPCLMDHLVDTVKNFFHRQK